MRPLQPPRPSTSAARRARPRGLWKGRGTPKPSSPGFDSDIDIDDRPSKRARYQHSDDTSDASDDDADAYCILEHESPDPVSYAVTQESAMDTAPSTSTDAKTAHSEDWDDLKELFARAADQYECDDVTEALPLLRGVIHECHRFLVLYEDPSVLFSEPVRPRSKSPDVLTPTPETKPKKCKCRESPTAFHAILGTALFLFGNLIAQDPALALPDEPCTPAPYWLAALDVFETGENLPSRTSGRGCEAQEDWRMAIVWGRTLVCVADEAVSLQNAGAPAPAGPEAKWPPESPFAAIAMRRPPASRRISLATAAPHELLLLAMDQFTRGIFHMPHPQHLSPSSSASVQQLESGSSAGTGDPAAPPPFSRAKELFTIASEVLALAERLPAPLERQRWAQWADSVFNQMDLEGDTAHDAWRGPITRARGRCWLVVGTARVEEIEVAAEAQGWDTSEDGGGVYASEEAEEAREGLARAVEFFERAAGGAKSEFIRADGDEGGGDGDAEEGEEERELRSFLTEALLTLANLTREEDKREELYRRAELLAGDQLEGMEMDESP